MNNEPCRVGLFISIADFARAVSKAHQTEAAASKTFGILKSHPKTANPILWNQSLVRLQ
jgi:hypothetical protein